LGVVASTGTACCVACDFLGAAATAIVLALLQQLVFADERERST